MKERNTYFDVLRAVAIVLVIANHTAGVAEDNLIVLVLNRFVKIAVPLFVAISGFFICRKPINSWSGYIQFLYKQLPRVYIPLLVFSLPFIFANGLSLRSIVGRTAMSFVGAGLYPYYFVFLIAQYYFLLPVYQRTTDLGCNFVNVILSFISIAIVTYFNGYLSADIPIYIYVGLFPVFSMFFAQGCYLGKNGNGRDYSIKLLLFILPFALVLACLEDWFWKTYYTDCGLTVSTFIFVYLVIWALFSKKVEGAFGRIAKTKVSRFLAEIGKMSFAIFLLHAYIIRIFERYDLLTSNWCINITIVLLVTIAITYAVEMVLPQRFHRYFGL